MLNVLIGAALSLVPLLAIGVYGYGKLAQKVEALPGALRLAMKLEIKEAFEEHIDKFRHEEKENTSPRMRAVAQPEVSP